MMNSISWKALGHRRNDNVLVAFSEHAGLGDGFAVLQGGSEINSA
jgi:hypothetical protein